MKMEHKKLSLILICGVLGSLLMAASDWLMIYGDVSYTGNLAWLTNGVSQISAKRNAFALMVAIPAVVLYAVALYEVGYLFKDTSKRSLYHLLTIIGMTPWLCIHLFYIMILFVFGYLHTCNQLALAHSLCELMFGQFSFIILAGEVLMILPFVYLMLQSLKGETILPKTFGYVNPIFLFIILKLVTFLMPNNGFRLAFTNGLMCDALLIWFILLYLKVKKSQA